MDRFIDTECEYRCDNSVYLKSNMDRFIESAFALIYKSLKFKIQYG